VSSQRAWPDAASSEPFIVNSTGSLSVSLDTRSRLSHAGHKCDARIVQKSQIVLVKRCCTEITHMHERLLLLLPDCASVKGARK
jgi:hypothetical protein